MPSRAFTRALLPACFRWALAAAALPAGCRTVAAVDRDLRGGSESHHRPYAGKTLSIDDLYGDPERRVDFNGSPPTNLVWLDDRRLLWPRTDPKTKESEWLEIEAESGKTAPFAPLAKVEAALAALPGMDAEKAKKTARSEAAAWAAEPRALLFTVDEDLYAYSFAQEAVVRVTSSPEEEEEEAALSPDGSRAAYVRGNDLYVADVATGAERRLTNDGGERILNGKLDWLYQEEIYGRGTWRGFWWSPDSARIAFLRLDEADVPIYTLVDDVASPAKVETSPYPRAGDPNPTVRLGVARVEDGTVEWVDLSKYADGEFLIVDVAWSPQGDLAFQVQDRVQTWLDLNLVEASARASEPHGSPAPVGTQPATLLRETSPAKAWVNLHGSPKWLDDGTFLWFSEKTGWKHVYRHDAAGKLLGTVTSGQWEARELRGVDEENGWVYFSGTERNPIGSDEYRVKLDGSSLQRLSRPRGSPPGSPRGSSGGTNSAKFNPSFTRYVGHWSDPSTATQVRLHRSDGAEVRVIDGNEVAALRNYSFSAPEFLKVRTRDGFEMEAMLIKPPGFDPSRRYPVFQPTYAGPHAPSVKQAWGGTNGMFLQLLAQRGIVVWVCDNRSASGKGAVSEWTCYRRCGEGELQDIEDGIAWLKRQPWVDPGRIGIYGWSYGGFMASYALTHSKSFAMGIAGGPVTDWRNYDTIYTERYMRTPQDNPEGYERTSVVAAAKDLHGELMLVHGALDDNVHPQNTMQLAYALQKAGKPFRMMLYPKTRHGLADKQIEKHARTTMLAFIEETLLEPASMPRPSVPSPDAGTGP